MELIDAQEFTKWVTEVAGPQKHKITQQIMGVHVKARPIIVMADPKKRYGDADPTHRLSLVVSGDRGV